MNDITAHMTPQLIERFWSHVDQSSGKDSCWEWKTGKGRYAYFIIEGKHVLSHRIAYELAFGGIPKGLEACHFCDNPSCCNPRHIFTGTHAENCRDCIRKKRYGKHSGKRGVIGSLPTRLIRERNGKSGSRNGRSKLNEEEVQQIRQNYATGLCSLRELAQRYQVSHGLIGLIIRRKIWQHIE